MRRFLIFLIGFFSALVTADTQFDLRYQIPRTLSNALQQTGIYRGKLQALDFNAGGRLTEEGYTPSKLDYFGELEYAPLSFINFSTRLAQSVRFVDSAGATTLFARVGLCARFGTSSAFCGRFGGFSRWNQLKSRPWVPFIYGSSIRELDLAIGFDLNIQWTESWSSELVLSTFESIDAFNLNNPYFQLALKNKEIFPGIEGYSYARYQVSLGFARLSAWVFGVGVNLSDAVFTDATLTDPPSILAPQAL